MDDKPHAKSYQQKQEWNTKHHFVSSVREHKRHTDADTNSHNTHDELSGKYCTCLVLLLLGVKILQIRMGFHKTRMFKCRRKNECKARRYAQTDTQKAKCRRNTLGQNPKTTIRVGAQGKKHRTNGNPHNRRHAAKRYFLGKARHHFIVAKNVSRTISRTQHDRRIA